VSTELVFDPVANVTAFLRENGYDVNITISCQTIFTVDDAALAVGAPAEHILKTLLLLVDEKPVLALMSGPNRVDLKKVKQVLGAKKTKMASPDFVYGYSGYKIGGVPPVGYPEKIPAVLDEDLFRYETVWAAAGTDHAFFPISPERLQILTEGRKADIKKER
jgi:Cys-tRNA(Pro) deacylase